MTPEMTFECLLASHDPAVFCTMNLMLQDLSIHTRVCPDPSTVSNLLMDGCTDLIVIDLESEYYSGLKRQIFESEARQKPIILAVSSADEAMPGVHIHLRKPVTIESGAKSLQVAYGRMLHDYRKYTRFAVMAPVLATDENGRTLFVTITNIGEGGVGFTTNPDIGGTKVDCPPEEPLSIGSIMSFRVPLPGVSGEISVQARLLWTRPYGAAGCEFVHIPSGDLSILHEWLENRCHVKKPLISF
jgi:PilZ domain